MAVTIVTRIYSEKRLFLTLFTVALNLLNPIFSAFAAEKGAQTSAAVQEQTNTYTDRTSGFSVELPKDFRLSSEKGDLLFFNPVTEAAQ